MSRPSSWPRPIRIMLSGLIACLGRKVQRWAQRCNRQVPVSAVHSVPKVGFQCSPSGTERMNGRKRVAGRLHQGLRGHAARPRGRPKQPMCGLGTGRRQPERSVLPSFDQEILSRLYRSWVPKYRRKWVFRRGLGLGIDCAAKSLRQTDRFRVVGMDVADGRRPTEAFKHIRARCDRCLEGETLPL